MASGRFDGPELAVVMPVYNEAQVVESVVQAWGALFDRLQVDWRFYAYDDGSTDDSLARLQRLNAQDPRVVVRHHANQGHGPTVITAYREAAGAEWILQIDSDDEIPVEAFVTLWQRRRGYDLLLGERQYGARPWARRAVSWASRQLVALLFGGGVQDVNSPYRLMRGASFRAWWARIPDHFLSPNLIITGLGKRGGLRVCCVPVPYQFRRTGTVSMRGSTLLRTASKSLAQTIYFRFVVFPTRRSD